MHAERFDVADDSSVVGATGITSRRPPAPGGMPGTAAQVGTEVRFGDRLHPMTQAQVGAG